MNYFVSEKQFFITEQDGSVERLFKSQIINLLKNFTVEVRAYLVQISYSEKPEPFNVAICYKLNSSEDNIALLNETAIIFKEIFGAYEHLDIIFLNFAQEEMLRKVCCPFFTSPLFQVQKPDFYLITEEGYVSEQPIYCCKRKKLIGVNPSGYLLCDIKPEIIGQQYGLGAENIKQVLLVCRHVDCNLFPIREWPTFVYVTRSKVNNIEDIDYIREANIELMCWGTIYNNKI